MARQNRQSIRSRIPFFRIFYSTTYMIIFFILLFFLAITPASLLFESIENNAIQYVYIISGVYVLTMIGTIFIYSSRLYTNRSVLAAVGKPYIPIEDGEIAESVRRMIVKQLKRSAIISWEARPRDLAAEVRYREKSGVLRSDDKNLKTKIEIIGTIVPVTIEHPPWGNIQHRGWTAPSNTNDELQSNLQFDTVTTELPNLLEARVVSLASAYPTGDTGDPVPDPALVEILRRQEKMGMREYLLQLSYLQLVDLDGTGGELLDRYEQARFAGRPPSIEEFKSLMTVFGIVMDEMTGLDPAIVAEVRRQSTVPNSTVVDTSVPAITLDADAAPNSSLILSVGSAPPNTSSRDTNAVHSYSSSARESTSSVLWSGDGDIAPSNTAQDDADVAATGDDANMNLQDSLDSDAGSIIHHHST